MRVLVALLPVLSACADHATGSVDQPQTPAVPNGAVAVLRCTARVAEASIGCEQVAGAPRAGGPRAQLRLLGGQGTYVRLASSAVAYNAGTGVLSFNVTVQNLTPLPFATKDGTVPYPEGVRVFFAAGPAVVEGSGTVTVLNATGKATFTAAGQDYFHYGGSELGADGILSPGEVSAARQWRMSVPTTATRFTFELYVSTETPPGELGTVAPQPTAVSPQPLVPGGTATITGINFAPNPAGNTVTINGVAAPVTGGTANTLEVKVPCVPGGAVPVQVTQGGMKGSPFAAPLQGSVQSLAPGQWVLVSDPAAVGCTELASAGGPAQYMVAVLNASPTRDEPHRFGVVGSTPGGTPASTVVAGGGSVRGERAAGRAAVAGGPAGADAHARLLDTGRREFARLQRRWGAGGVRAARAPRAAVTPPPATRAFRVPIVASGTPCTSYAQVTATRVYYSGKLAIYEDVATSPKVSAAGSAEMAGYYQKMGDQFNADMEPVLRQYFGDPLVRDTDQDGVVTLLVTPQTKRNGQPWTFSSTCDLYPNGAGNTSSNFGEVIYAPTPYDGDIPNESSLVPFTWYRYMRAWVMHESYHLTANAAHLANGHAFLEEAWLDESLAMAAEELWARTALYGVPWKGDGGWGSESVYGPHCSYNFPYPVCRAHPYAPVRAMTSHWAELGSAQSAPHAVSHLSWGLVRNAVDHFAVSESAFFTALTQAGTTGMENLAARAGVGREELYARWVLAMYTDNFPAAATPGLQFPAWNLKSINQGRSQNDPYSGMSSTPLKPTTVSFGTFPLLVFDLYGGYRELRGGSFWYYRISGTQTAPQTFGARDVVGGPPPSDFRLVILRTQ